MSGQESKADALLAACDAVLREVGGYPISADRLEAALPLIREIVSAIREMDEVDVAAVEPVTVFRLLP